MSNEQQRRTCSECYEPMDARARVCPHCGRIQWRRAWPRMLAGFVPVLLLGVTLMAWGGWMKHRLMSSPNPEGLAAYAGQIKVTESRMEFGQSSDGPVVLVVGMLRNDSDIAWGNVKLDVRFFDPQGRLIDVNVRDYYLSAIRPRGEMAFKLRGPADLPRQSYARYEVSVRSAEDAGQLF